MSSSWVFKLTFKSTEKHGTSAVTYGSLNSPQRVNCDMSYNCNFYCILLCCTYEQIENVDDIELSNTVSVNSACDSVCNNVSLMQQVECFCY